MKDKLKIIGVKTDKGYYLAGKHDNDRLYDIHKYLINGKQPEKTFHSTWAFLSEEPILVAQTIKQPNINHRYELISDSPWIGKTALPKMMPKDEVMEKNDYDGCVWKEEFRHLQSLYKLESDPQPDKIEPVEFEYQTILEIAEINIAKDFKYAVGEKFAIRADAIKHQLIDQIIFPDIVLPMKPSKLSSKATYEIIREHIKRNIDPRYAKITSDYNFCFEVAKTISLASPIEGKTEIKTASGRSYRNPQYRHYTITSRPISKIFEMTHDEDKYRGYTVIEGFSGENHQDLKNKIDKYLDDLMARINEPLVDCPHCDGMGVISRKIQEVQDDKSRKG